VKYRDGITKYWKLTKYQASEAFTSEGTLREFWSTNGKSFNWAGLPTELKENIIQFCIGTSPCVPTRRNTWRDPCYLDHFHDLSRIPSCPQTKLRPCEVVDRLGRWKGLVRVSTQIRAIALRLCFNGSLVSGVQVRTRADEH